MGMFIFVHLTPASCNWLCYGCHSNALSVALAAVILHSSAWLSSKTNKRENESVCCLHLLVLRDNWPCHGGQAASVPLPHPYHPPSTQNALQRLLANPHSLSQSALEEFPSITYIVWLLYRSSPCYPSALDEFFSAQTSSLCPFVRASALRSTERWTLTCPIPASLSFTVPAQKNENGYEESFCLYGGDT